MSATRATDALSSVSRSLKDSLTVIDQQYHAVYIQSISRVLAIERYTGIPQSSRTLPCHGTTWGRIYHKNARHDVRYSGLAPRCFSTHPVQSNPPRPPASLRNPPASGRPSSSRPPSTLGSQPTSADEIDLQEQKIFEQPIYKVNSVLDAEARERAELRRIEAERRHKIRLARQQEREAQQRKEARETAEFKIRVDKLRNRILENDQLLLYQTSVSSWLRSALEACYERRWDASCVSRSKLNDAIVTWTRQVETLEAKLNVDLKNVEMGQHWRQQLQTSEYQHLRELDLNDDRVRAASKEIDIAIKERKFVMAWIHWRRKQLAFQFQSMQNAENACKGEFALMAQQTILVKKLNTLDDALPVAAYPSRDQWASQSFAEKRWAYEHAHVRSRPELWTLNAYTHRLRQFTLDSLLATILPQSQFFEAAAVPVTRIMTAITALRAHIRNESPALDILWSWSRSRHSSLPLQIRRIRGSIFSMASSLADTWKFLRAEYGSWNPAATRPGLEPIREIIDTHTQQTSTTSKSIRSLLGDMSATNLSKGAVIKLESTSSKVNRSAVTFNHELTKILVYGNLAPERSHVLQDFTRQLSGTTIFAPRLDTHFQEIELERLFLPDHITRTALLNPADLLPIRFSARKKFSIPVWYIMSQSGFDSAMHELAGNKVLGIDIVSIRESLVEASMCISLATPSKAYVVEITPQLDLSRLRVLLEDQDVCKVAYKSDIFMKLLSQITTDVRSVVSTRNDLSWVAQGLAAKVLLSDSFVASFGRSPRPTYQNHPKPFKVDFSPPTGWQPANIPRTITDLAGSSLFNLYTLMNAVTAQVAKDVSRWGPYAYLDPAWLNELQRMRHDVSQQTAIEKQNFVLGPIQWDNDSRVQSSGLLALLLSKQDSVARRPDLVAVVEAILLSKNALPNNISLIAQDSSTQDEPANQQEAKAWILYAIFAVDVPTIARLLGMENPVQQILQFNSKVVPEQAADVSELESLQNLVFDTKPLPEIEATPLASNPQSWSSDFNFWTPLPLSQRYDESDLEEDEIILPAITRVNSTAPSTWRTKIEDHLAELNLRAQKHEAVIVGVRETRKARQARVLGTDEVDAASRRKRDEVIALEYSQSVLRSMRVQRNKLKAALADGAPTAETDAILARGQLPGTSFKTAKVTVKLERVRRVASSKGRLMLKTKTGPARKRREASSKSKMALPILASTKVRKLAGRKQGYSESIFDQLHEDHDALDDVSK